MYERIISSGTVDYAGKQCAFRERQIFGGFSEISFRGGAYTEYVVPEINNVQIVFEYCFFVVFTVEFARNTDFVYFSAQRFFAGQMRVFNKLLSNRAGAFFDFSAEDIVFCRGNNAQKVYAVMTVKTLVFYGDKSVQSAIVEAVNRTEIFPSP